MTHSCAVYLIEDQYRDAVNKLWNMIYLREGWEDQIGTMNFGRAVASVNDPEVITHWVGSCPSSEEWESWFSYLPEKFANNEIVPPNGSWPWMVDNQIYLTENDALEAANKTYININQGESVNGLSQENIATVFAAKNLVFYEWPEE